MSTKKKVAASAAAVLIAALLLGGAFAWTDFTQAFTNIFHAHPAPDVLLHDDFTPNKNKDVYVENTGNTPLYVRVSFYEYLQVGNKVVVGNTAATPAVAVKDKSTYQKHFWSPMPDASGLQSKWNRPTSQYYDWYLTGAQKLYLPGTSEIDDVDYAALGYSAGDVPSPTDGIKGLAGNGNALRYTKPATPIVTMDWFSKQSDTVKGAYKGWVLDSDGYAYWSQKLMPNTATNLLLDKVLPKPDNAPDDNSYYAIDVRLRATNASEVYKMYADSAGNSTISPEAQQWIDADALKPAKDDPTLPEKIDTVTGDGLTDAEKAALLSALTSNPVATDDITNLGLNNAKKVYEAAQVAQDALNAEIAKGSSDPALVERLAREASSLEALGDRMTKQNPPDGELPAGTVATVDGNGFAKTVDAGNGYTLLNALNFPDPNLLALLTQSGGYDSGVAVDGTFGTLVQHVDSIDTDPAGGDGRLSPAELAAVTSIYLVNNPPVSPDPKIDRVASLEGVELFPNLTTLQVAATQVSTVSPDKNPLLTALVVSGSVAGINTANNPQLQQLVFIGLSQTHDLDLSNNKNLVALRVSATNLQSIDLSNYTSLQLLAAYDDPNLTFINLDGCTALRTLDARNNAKLSSINVSNCTSLLALMASVNDGTKGSLTTITGFSDCTAISTLYLQNQSLSSLDISATHLVYNNNGAQFYNNNLTSLKVPAGSLANWQNAGNATNATNHLQGNFGAASGDATAAGADVSKITE